MQNDKEKFKNEFKSRLYQFVLRLIRLIEALLRDRTCAVLGNQLLRSGTSILANCVECKSASSKRDFIKYFEISLKSANESKMWILLLRDTNKINYSEYAWLQGEIGEIANIFGSSLLTLKGKK